MDSTVGAGPDGSGDDVLDLGTLPEDWDALGELARRVAMVDDQYQQTPLPSDRLLDCQKFGSNGKLLYISAHQLISTALDHNTLARQLVTEGPIRPHSTWSPVRAALETAAMSAWLLSPDDPQERVCRAVRQAYADADADVKRRELLEEMNQGDAARLAVAVEQRDKRADWLRERGLPKKNWKPSLTEDLRDIAGLTPAMKPEVVLVWRLLSGLLHGDTGALILTIDYRDLQQTVEGHSAFITPKPHTLRQIMSVAIWMQERALELFEERTLRTTERESTTS